MTASPSSPATAGVDEWWIEEAVAFIEKYVSPPPLDVQPADDDVRALAALLSRISREAELRERERCAKAIKDAAERIMQDYVMSGPAGIVRGCIAAIHSRSNEGGGNE